MRPASLHTTPDHDATARNETHASANRALFAAGTGADSVAAICAANERLVWFWVHRSRWRESDPADLHAAGMEGLLHAVGKYDLAHGTTFATYATWWIRQAIDRAGQRDARWRQHTTPLETHLPEPSHRYDSGADTATAVIDADRRGRLRGAVAAGTDILRVACAVDGNLAAAARHTGAREGGLRWQLQQEASRLAHPASGILDDPWRDDAACTDMDVAAFFPGNDEAKRRCDRCPIREMCADVAVQNRRIAGLWGGTTARDRQRLRRANRGQP
jgi:RNA polymerase sigma factor (sigma-70 family)